MIRETLSQKVLRSVQSPPTFLSWFLFWRLAFVFVLLIALVGLGLFLFSPDWIRIDRGLPVGIQSLMRANYSADPVRYSVQPLQKNLYMDVLMDQSQTAQSPVNQLATLEERLRTPVPTITQASPQTPQAVFTLTPTSVSTRGTSTKTAQPSPTLTVTSTETAAPTVTARVKQTLLPTQEPPTAAPTEEPPAATIVPTDVPPSPTMVPTDIPTAIPTLTPMPTLTLVPPLTPAPTNTPDNSYPPPGE